MRIEHDAQRRRQCHASVGADPVQPDHLGRMFLPGRGNPPQCRSRGAETLADSQNKAAGNQNREAEPADLV